MESKICSNPKCGKEKPLSDFYKNKGMKDGRVNKCKECTKKSVTIHREKNIDKIRAYDRERSKLPHRIKLNDKTCKMFRKQFPLAYKAHNAVNNAVRDGRLIKPTKCPSCKKSARQIEGHHKDYNKPLDVIWLCSICHRRLDKDLNRF